MSSKLPFGVMDTASVSKSFYTATARVCELMTLLYEDLHDESGATVIDEKYITNKINTYKRVIRPELKLIKKKVEQ